MDKALFEKYINEMKDMKKRSRFPNDVFTVPTKAEGKDTATLTQVDLLTESTSKQNTNPPEGKGYLLVDVTSVRELYPVANAKITVFTGEEDNRTVFAEGVTDISGKAGPFALVAPGIEYSETPNSAVLPFAYYNILTSADGFVSTIHLKVQIFDKVTSIQKVNLLPISNGGENATIIIDESKDKGEI